MRVSNLLGTVRKQRGFSASDLALRVGVSRQTIYSIEDGTFLPNTAISLQLARALDVAVEDLFSIEEEQPGERIDAEMLPDGEQRPFPGGFVRLCRVHDRLVAVPVSYRSAYLPAADAIAGPAAKGRVPVDSASEIPKQGSQLLLAGCDPALSFLSELLRSSNVEIITVPTSSRLAFQWLKQGKVHAAGSHLLDRTTGDYNLPFVRRAFPKESVRVVTFGNWEQGLVVARGNPKGIREVADLSRKGIRLINREKGAGSRDLLDAGLRKAGIASANVKGYTSLAHGHLAAAEAVAAGRADCCIAPRSAARCFGLDFTPLAVERFDLTFSQASLDLAATKALLDLLNRSRLQRKLQTLAGYDTAHTGDVLL